MANPASTASAVRIENGEGAVACHAFVGRQPIFDAELAVQGYELLFREGTGNEAGAIDDGQRATSSVLLQTFFDLGLERIAGEHAAWINCPREFLVDDCHLPSERVVLEVLEDVEIDDALVEGLRRLVGRGYVLALDDFEYSPLWDPLIELASVIKVDIRKVDEGQARRWLQEFGGPGTRFLAEKVETREEFERFRDLGFELFQGFFLARPNIVTGRRLPAYRLSTVQLLGKLQDPDITLADVEALVRQDVSLTYKLLRYVNSPLVGVRREIESIRQAIVMVGLATLRRWVSMMALASDDERPPEIMCTALTRARMCELLGEQIDPANSGTYFTVGLCSALDLLLETELALVLEELPLAAPVRAAILEREGPMGEALACALAFEGCHFEAASCGGLPPEELTSCYADASAWSFETLKVLSGGGPGP